MAGLQDHIDRKADIFDSARQIFAESGVPESLSDLSASCRSDDASGVRRISIRQFEIVSDSGTGMAGQDSGPSSPELLLGALSSCLSHVFITQAAVLGMRLDGIEADVSAKLQNGSAAFPHPTIPSHPIDFRYDVTVTSPESDDDLLSLWAAVRRHCPIYLLLSKAVPIAGVLYRHGDSGRRELGRSHSDDSPL